MAYPPVPYPPLVIESCLDAADGFAAVTLPQNASMEATPTAASPRRSPAPTQPAMDEHVGQDEIETILPSSPGAQGDQALALQSDEREDEADTRPDREGSSASYADQPDAAAPQDRFESLNMVPDRQHPKPLRSVQGLELSPPSSTRHREALNFHSTSDPHAKARIATEIIRLEHKVAKLRRARQIQRANERGEHDSTERLEQLAEKWREAGLLAEELLRDRYGVAEPATSSSTSSHSRLSPLFPTGADDDASSTISYPSPYSGYSPNTSAASLRFKSMSKSDSDRLDDFKQSIAAAARARGVSEKRILREMDDDDEGGADLPDPETAFERMLPLNKKVKREETPADENFAMRAFERLATPLPVYKSNSWKPPRQDPAKRSGATAIRKEPALPLDVLDLADQADSSDDELMKALDAAMEATSPLALRVGRRRHQVDEIGKGGVTQQSQDVRREL